MLCPSGTGGITAGRHLAGRPGGTWQDGRMAPLMLLDSASLYYRAFYGVPDTMTAPDGTPVNAVRGLLDMIACMDAD